MAGGRDDLERADPIVGVDRSVGLGLGARIAATKLILRLVRIRLMSLASSLGSWVEMITSAAGSFSFSASSEPMWSAWAWVGRMRTMDAPLTSARAMFLADPQQRLTQEVEALLLEQVADDLLRRHPLRLGHRGDSSRRVLGRNRRV